MSSATQTRLTAAGMSQHRPASWIPDSVLNLPDRIGAHLREPDENRAQQLPRCRGGGASRQHVLCPSTDSHRVSLSQVPHPWLPFCSSSPGPSALQSYPQKNDRDSYIKGLKSSQVALSDVQDRTILHSPSKIEANREIPWPAVHLKCYNPSLPPVGKHPPFQAPRPVPSYNLCYFGTPQPPENPVIKQPSTPLAFL